MNNEKQRIDSLFIEIFTNLDFFKIICILNNKILLIKLAKIKFAMNFYYIGIMSGTRFFNNNFLKKKCLV